MLDERRNLVYSDLTAIITGEPWRIPFREDDRTDSRRLAASRVAVS
jgi:hypothetical protein